MNSVITSFSKNNSKIVTAIAKIWFILKTNIFKVPIVTNITLFDALFLLMQIPSEISILSYSSTYNSYKHSFK